MASEQETLSLPAVERGKKRAPRGSPGAWGYPESGWTVRVVTASGIAVTSAGVLLFDLAVPQGVAVGALYCVLVLCSAWLRSLRFTLALALLFTLMIGIGWYYSTAGVSGWIVFVNRALSAVAVWLTSALVSSRVMASERLRIAVAAAPACMIVADRRGRIRYANSEAESTLGTEHHGLQDHLLSEFLPLGPALRGRLLRRSLSRPLRTVSYPLTEVECRRIDGASFPAEVAVRSMRTEFGQMQLVTVRDLSEDRTREEVNERLATIVRSSPDAVIAKNLEGKITDWNPGAEEIYGFTAEEIVGRPTTDLHDGNFSDQQDEILEAVRAGHSVSQIATRHRTKSGRVLDIDMTVAPIRDRVGRIVGASAIARDVTKEREAERGLVELNLALGQAMPGLATLDAEGHFTTANEDVRRLTGTTATNLVGSSWLDVLAPSGRNQAKRAFEAMVREGCAELSVRACAEEERYVEAFLVRRLDSAQRFTGALLFLRNVTERVSAIKRVRELAADLSAANRQLEQLAHVDPLTGLLNRRGLERHVCKPRAGGRRSQRPTSVVLVDVDDFKRVNSEYGHAGGDRALVGVAHALEEATRPSDCVARIGGDEFLVVLTDTSLGEATLIAERMRARVEASQVTVEGHTFSVTSSFGVALLAGGEASVEELLDAVTDEFSQSKSDGKNRVSAGSAAPSEEPPAARLAEVLAGRGLRAVCQPIRDLVEDRVVAHEMLVRGPAGRYESPGAIFDLPHPGESSARLDLACLRTCAEAAADLPPGDVIHINVFPATLLTLGAESVLHELRQFLEGRIVCLELNERDLPGDSRELREVVGALRAQGIQIAIDDVGFGKTSLEALVHLVPDVIKLDRSCLASEPDALERLLSVASVLRARVVAEGIETEEMRTRLKAAHVRYGQGFLWGRPQPVAATDDGVLQPLPRVARSAASSAERAPRKSRRAKRGA